LYIIRFPIRIARIRHLPTMIVFPGQQLAKQPARNRCDGRDAVDIGVRDAVMPVFVSIRENNKPTAIRSPGSRGFAFPAMMGKIKLIVSKNRNSVYKESSSCLAD
jgi:hypothetical protein